MRVGTLLAAAACVALARPPASAQPPGGPARRSGAPVSVPNTDAALATRGIHTTIARMRSAVEAADSGAYMALVDTRDPVFAEEQRKWARDLRTRPVAGVRFDATSEPRPGAGGRWTVGVRIEWTLPGEGAPRELVFDAAFRPVGLPEGAWVFAGRSWRRVDAPGARILVAPGDGDALEMAEYLAERVGDILGRVEAELEETLKAEPTIKIYPDMASLQASIALSYTDPLGGWNEPGESIKLLGGAGYAGPRMDPTVAHELGHAVSFEYGPAAVAAPWWVLEGIAEIAADAVRERPHGDAARALSREGRLVGFERLADFRGEAMNHAHQVYAQGRSMLAFVGERHGRTVRNRWVRAMAEGHTLDDATRGVLGQGFDDLDRAWRDWLARDPD